MEQSRTFDAPRIDQTMCPTSKHHRKPHHCAVPAVQQAGDLAGQVGSAMVHSGMQPGGRACVFGSNCPEWMLAMQVCSASGQRGVADRH